MIVKKLKKLLFEFLIEPQVRQRALLIDFVIKHPMALLPALIPYYIASVLNVGVAVGIYFALSPIAPQDFQVGIALLYFACVEIVIIGDYIILGIRCFVSAVDFNGYAGPILRVLQLVFISVLIFSAVHYYVALFAIEEPAYHGIAPLSEENRRWFDWLQRVTFIPSIDTLINCLYFSTVTMATVGYGDVFPVSRYAKIATIVQIMFSFGLIVVILAWAVGNAREIASRETGRRGAGSQELG